jgi:hypothetical protein
MSVKLEEIIYRNSRLNAVRFNPTLTPAEKRGWVQCSHSLFFGEVV